jgi:hypothetical protein
MLFIKKNIRLIIVTSIFFIPIVLIFLHFQEERDDKEKFGKWCNLERTKLGVPTIENNWESGDYIRDYRTDTTGKIKIVIWSRDTKFSTSDSSIFLPRHSSKWIYVKGNVRINEEDNYFCSLYLDKFEYELNLNFSFKEKSFVTSLTQSDPINVINKYHELIDKAKFDYQEKQKKLPINEQDNSEHEDSFYDEEGELFTEAKKQVSINWVWKEKALSKADSVLNLWELKRK